MLANVQLLGAQICQWDTAPFLFFSKNVFSDLIYYSHFVPIIISLIFGGFIFFNNRKDPINKILIAIILVFTCWVLFDLILWASERVDFIMFFWSSQIYLDPLIYVGSFYLVYLFLFKTWPTLKWQLLLFFLLFPVVALAPTPLNLTAFDFTNCGREAIEGPLWHYVYGVELFIVLLIVSIGVFAFRKIKDREIRKRNTLLVFGTMLFLLTFSSGNIVGSFGFDWRLAQYGLFGMPIFIVFLSYLAVRYKAFNVKLISTQAIVFAGGLLILGLLFLQDIPTIKVVASITLILFAIAGYLLIRSVKREIDARAKIEKLAEGLEESNKGQENLIHVMNHQIKGYLAKDRNVFSELLADGEYGSLNDMGKTMIEQGFESATKGIDFVQDILKGSSAQKGTLPYNMEAIDFRKVVSDVVAGQRKTAEDKGLKFEFTAGVGDYTMTGDPTHLSEAVRNLIDNSINYTQQGSINLSLNRAEDKIVFVVKDTGIGINDEDKTKLFTQGGRGKESSKINVNSTGYGLVFVKSVAEAHKGSVRADSLGTGKGSTFTLELPAGK